MKKNKKKTKFKINSKHIVLLINLICILWLTYLIFHLRALPLKFELLLLSPFYIIFFLFVALLLRIKNKGGQIFTQVICVALSIAVAFGSVYISKGQNLLNKISGANKKTYTMSVVVPESSEITEISQLLDKNIELVSKNDLNNMNLAMEAIKAELSSVYFNIEEDYQTIINDLFGGTADALLINEAYRSLLEVEDEQFSDKTRVIWNYEVTEDMEDIRKQVNVVNTPFTIYISGIDTYGPISTVSRTDVNMLMTVNPNTKEILLTSIPRDAWVLLTNMNAYDKLTHSGIAGVENSISTIENFMGIEINYYARVNFSSVVAVVDALDGIWVYNKYEISNGAVTYPQGYISLNGEEALAYARERHAYDYMFEDSERGDQMRVENQQAVLEGIINKVTSPAILSNYSNILDAVEGMFETNLSTNEITDLISMQLDDMAVWKFVHMKITGEYEYKYGGAYMPDWHLIYYVTNPSSVQQCREAIENMLNNKKIS